MSQKKERKKERKNYKTRQASQAGQASNFIGRGRYKVLQVLSFCKFVVPGKLNM